MISNLWNSVRLVCGCHPDSKGPVYMQPHDSPTSKASISMYGNSLNMFYSCPKYYPDNREPGEHACRNHISLKEFEKMLEVISKELEAGDDLTGSVQLVGLTWKSKSGIEYKVVRQTEKHIDVMCINRRALK